MPSLPAVSICRNCSCRTENYAAGDAGSIPRVQGRQATVITQPGRQLPLRSRSGPGEGAGAGQRGHGRGEGAARHLRTALFMLLQNVQRPCFSGCRSGSHSVRGSTFRIVSSFTFFPRGSRLLGRGQRLLRRPSPGEMSAQAHAHAALPVWSLG